MGLSRYHSFSGNVYSEPCVAPRAQQEPVRRERPRNENFKRDYFVGSRNVFNLNVLNFKQFLGDKEKTLVMFYNSDKCQPYGLENEFAKIADKNDNDSYGFGAVDCATDGPICTGEDACQTPMFKLYSNGYEVSGIRDTSRFNAKQVFLLMVMTPTLVGSRNY
ncbi:unnamed protein product [Candidula unifasciata]|uniref:Thioredoxin domain-containing protein n=1 Tax=Candidula unifasciata TaxID=100452 RepID=A0A8S4A424_9EUPU|nr:unnamed protein product [Candidula unifasciata]